MPRLSCIIPVMGNTQALETTLVSILEKRPDNCEIIVVLNAPYADPYGLKGEVRFVDAPAASMAACATLGIQISRAPIVHVLAAGMEVVDDWADMALPHFSDPEIGSVIPVIRDSANPERLLAAGLRYGFGGRRSVATNPPNRDSSSEFQALGPTIDAAFYRKAALEALGDGLPVNLGDQFADVDLALGLQYTGYRTALEPQCVVFAERLVGSEQSGFHTGLHAERFFLRNLPVSGWLRGFTMHPLTVAADLLRSLPRRAALTQLAGRLTAWFSLSDYRLHHHLLAVARETVARETAERDSTERAVIAKLPKPEVIDDPSIRRRQKRAG
ncbi:MAG TPA: glycosyltransferase family 2 protein [Pirellulales bacterium]|nr:glycosyltransferase family 2 protein [Pirellulales bacterium]